jgi:hypothetical protein
MPPLPPEVEVSLPLAKIHEGTEPIAAAAEVER